MTESLPLKELLQKNTRPAAAELVVCENRNIRCLACGHRCLIPEGRSGICKVRSNHNGELLVPWGYVAALQCDPIEKKPFFHAFPGRDALTFGMLGCDFHCGYCQNWVTSQALRDPRAVAPPKFCQPDELVETALRLGAPVLASSYNEPLITSEWAADVFQVARRHNLTCAYISNGNATPEVLRFLRPVVDLYKVDLKGFDDKHYRQLGGVLRNVLDSIERIKSMGFWLEVVTLIVPGFNDSDAELRAIAKFLAGVSPEVPWHVTAFHPDYKMDESAGYSHGTSVDTLVRAYDIGKEAGLWFVYAGNLPGEVGQREDTCCPNCGSVAIRRRGFTVLENTMKGDCCSDCGNQIPGFWKPFGERNSYKSIISRPDRSSRPFKSRS
jgi:pyruvate formate lyase activating enzyme